MKLRRILTILLASGMLQACAAVKDEVWNDATSCGPAVSRNSVRVIDARDNYAAGGLNAAIDRAIASVGELQLLDYDVHRVIHFAAIKGNSARRGCDVVIHVQVDRNVENSGWDAHFVLLARRTPNSAE